MCACSLCGLYLTNGLHHLFVSSLLTLLLSSPSGPQHTSPSSLLNFFFSHRTLGVPWSYKYTVALLADPKGHWRCLFSPTFSWEDLALIHWLGLKLDYASPMKKVLYNNSVFCTMCMTSQNISVFKFLSHCMHQGLSQVSPIHWENEYYETTPFLSV